MISQTQQLIQSMKDQQDSSKRYIQPNCSPISSLSYSQQSNIAVSFEQGLISSVRRYLATFKLPCPQSKLFDLYSELPEEFLLLNQSKVQFEALLKENENALAQVIVDILQLFFRLVQDNFSLYQEQGNLAFLLGPLEHCSSHFTMNYEFDLGFRTSLQQIKSKKTYESMITQMHEIMERLICHFEQIYQVQTLKILTEHFDGVQRRCLQHCSRLKEFMFQSLSTLDEGEIKNESGMRKNKNEGIQQLEGQDVSEQSRLLPQTQDAKFSYCEAEGSQLTEGYIQMTQQIVNGNYDLTFANQLTQEQLNKLLFAFGLALAQHHQYISEQTQKTCIYFQHKILKMIHNFKYIPISNEPSNDSYFPLRLLFAVYLQLQQDGHYDIQCHRFMVILCETLVNQQLAPKNLYLRGILKLIENQNLFQKLNPFRKVLLRRIPYRDEEHYPSDKSMIFLQETAYICGEQVQQAIKKQIAQIGKNWSDIQNQRIPNIDILKLTNCHPQRVVTIVISGFLSEDSSKYEQWINFLQAMQDCEVYAIRWESGTINDMMKFGVDKTKQMLSTRYSGWLMKPILLSYHIGKAFLDNPFTEAIKNSKITGKYLAELLIRNFRDNFINLVAFSLGCDLLNSIMTHLIQWNCEGIINQVVTIGAASTLEDTNKIISSSKTQINWTNFHGDDDYAIRFALRIFKLFQKPLGIYRIPDIQGHKIVNIDTSGFVSGHLDYRKKLYQLTKMIHLREN